MGNAPPSRPQLPLHENDAFAIATHWHAQLRNWVTLSTHDEYTREPVAFLDAQHAAKARHLEWVTLGLPMFIGDADDAEVVRSAQAARASVIAWLALSRCDGFSGRENPRFWKRVFARLWAGNQQRAIADDIRFFDHTDRPFPCVRIKPRLGEQKGTLRAFFRASATDRELRRVLKPLAPHLAGREWWRRAVPVEIVGVELSLIAKYHPKGYLPKHESSRGPKFRLVAVRVSMPEQKLTPEAFLAVAHDFGDVEVYVPSCHAEMTSLPIDIDDASVVLQHLRIGTIRPRVAPPGEEPSFAAICSMIPRTRVVSALELKGVYDRIQLNAVSAAWLGYALFHPDTAEKSALTALVLGLPHLRTDVVDVLAHMATGNNLLLVMGATTTASSAYFEARLTPRTRVHADGAEASPVLSRFPTAKTVTLCVASVEELQGNAWVRIVVPGFGLGWVSTKQIVSVVSRTPGRGSLRRLELSERRYHEGHLSSAAPQLFSLLGASLTHLKIQAEIPTLVVRMVLQSCPNLVALRMYHDGECWSSKSDLQALPYKPRLRTLELLISGPFQPLVASQLDDMTCLRVIDQDITCHSIGIHREALFETLRRYPRLSHVYWSSRHCHPPPWWEKSGFMRTWAPLTWTNKDQQSTSYRLLGDGVRGVLDVAHMSLPLGVRLAFLSVFGSRTDRGNSLPRLSSDVMRLILEFSTSSVPRQLLVRYNDTDPYE